MLIRKIEESVRNERYEIALDFAAKALSSSECVYNTENTILVLGYKMHCLVKLDLFRQAAIVSDGIHDILSLTFDFPTGSYPNRRATPDELLAFLSSFAADYYISIGDSIRAETFIEAAVIYADVIKNSWLDEYIIGLTVRLLDGNMVKQKKVLEWLYLN